MKKEKTRHQALESFLGIPKLHSLGKGLFNSPKEMQKNLDPFLRYLSSTYCHPKTQQHTNNMFGFIIRQLKIIHAPEVEEITLSMNPGQGVASVLIPLSPTSFTPKDPQELARQLHQIASIYFPSLPVAQIQAQMQLYCLLTDEGKRKLSKKNKALGHRKQRAT